MEMHKTHSLADYQLQSEGQVRQLKESGEPVILTIDGQAEVVVQSAQAYQALVDDHELLEDIRGVARGLQQSLRGEGEPLDQFIESLARQHGLRLK